MNFATTKRRILQYIDLKGITIAKFLAETDIKRGFLDTDKLDSSVTDVFLAKIIATYSDINLLWLITGKGNILHEEEQNILQNVKPLEISNQTLEELVQTQRQLLKMKDEKIAFLERELNKDLEGNANAS